MENDSPYSLTVVYDNESQREDLIADWGFSCVVRVGDCTVLFDTGANGEILSHNLMALYGSLSIIKDAKIFISHDHWDHVGGVAAMVKKYSQTCYIPSSSSKELEDTITSSSGKVLRIFDPTEICSNIWSTGELEGSFKEQSLVVRFGKKLVLVTGCAHPGIVSIVENVTSKFKQPLDMVLGGFHWFKNQKNEVESQINCLRQMGVQKIAPCHCSGSDAVTLARENWKDGFVEVTSGARICF
jgi:7,8-dihydropterin-6-yl-methyl-4-(beta-D-ribofuranosyl)aminobenzene 5'-phosphate synthase